MRKTVFLLYCFCLCAFVNAQQESSQQITQRDIVQFSATLIDQNVRLFWTVGYNEDVKSFEIERLEKDSVYKKIGGRLPVSVAGSLRYEFVDAMVKNPLSFYRVRAIHKDGSVSLSDLQSPKAVEETVFRLKNNPVRTNLDVEAVCAQPVVVTATVYTADGVQLQTQTVSLHAGSNSMSLSSQSLKVGLHRLVIVAGKERKVFSFVKE